jgi:AraC-like DNA-binding protein
VTEEAISPVQYFLPDDDLAEYISTFYIGRFPVEALDELERADRPQFRIRLNDVPGEYHLANGTILHVEGATIIGPTSAPVRAISHGPVFLIGMGLTPGGWATLMGPDAPKYADRILHAQDMFGDWINAVGSAIAAAADDATRIAMMAGLARDIMRRGEPAPLWFTHAVDQWLAASATPHIDDLIAATQLSIRTIERMTKRFYGLPPTTLARKYRALRAASALARGDSLADSGVADAFYDQSHLIRELKQFAGTTPSKLAQPSEYTRATTEGRHKLAGKISPLISDT